MKNVKLGSIKKLNRDLQNDVAVVIGLDIIQTDDSRGVQRPIDSSGQPLGFVQVGDVVVVKGRVEHVLDVVQGRI